MVPARWGIRVLPKICNGVQTNGLERGMHIAISRFNEIDFLLYSNVKQSVYEKPPTTRNNIKERNRHAFKSVDDNILINVNNPFLKRLRLCYLEAGYM